MVNKKGVRDRMIYIAILVFLICTLCVPIFISMKEVPTGIVIIWAIGAMMSGIAMLMEVM